VGVSPEAIVTADLGNGHQDIVVLNTGQAPDSQSSVSVVLGNGDGTFRSAVTTNVLAGGRFALAGAHCVAVGDFNGDGKADLAVADPTQNVVEILRGNGDGTFQSNPLILHAPGASSVAVGDFAHNGKIDLAVADSSSNTVSVFLGNGDGTFQNPVNYVVSAGPETVTAFDPGNGQIDLAVASLDSNTVSVLQGTGDGTFRPGQSIAVPGAFQVKAGDFNGDGKPDLLVEQALDADAGHESVEVLFGNGDGTFNPGPSQSRSFGLIDLALGDFNGDGKLDFAMANALGAGVEVFAGQGDGLFDSPVNVQDSFNNFALAAGDFRGDGRTDLVVANTFTKSIGVLLNTSGPVAAATTTTLGTSAATAAFGQKETLTATVNSALGTPSGTVNFFDGTTLLGTRTLDAAGQAALTVSLGVGTHSLRATYVGNSAFAASLSAAVTETVHRAATAVALSPSINPAVVGQKVTFTAPVTAVAPGAGTPAGTVSFFDGSKILGTVAVGAGGKATFVTSFSTAGSHSIKAVYNGNGDFTVSSRTITEQVRLSSKVALGASANPVPVGRPVTFTATVIPASGTTTPTGTITFMDGDVVLAKVTLVNGKATLTRSDSTKGSHIIEAVYSGDSLFAASLQTLTELVS
jgi:hypothetical protein